MSALRLACSKLLTTSVHKFKPLVPVRTYVQVSRTANTILMVRPYDFGFNEETGLDNEFQNKPSQSQADFINKKANEEFQGMVDQLRGEGINVLVLEKPEGEVLKTPDAIFPNNWFSTEHDGTLITYPMAAQNRRRERRVEDVEKLLNANGYPVRNVINVGRVDERERFLEGTGSMIIDHRAEFVYAAKSNRCDPDQFDNFMRLRYYEKGIMFDTKSSTGNPIYHTNVVMSLGDKFSVCCLECIDEKDRQMVEDTLSEWFDLIPITMDQMENYMCGNILQVNSGSGEPRIIMSQRAHDGFTQEQRDRLGKYGKLLPVDLDTIETIGGGSARCMMAEIFMNPPEEE